MGENIFETSVAQQVQASHLSISAATVIAAGPTKLRSLTTDPTTLRKLQDAYAYGIRMVMYFALAAACAAVPFALGMEWRNVKKEAAMKRATRETADHDGLGKESGGIERYMA